MALLCVLRTRQEDKDFGSSVNQKCLTTTFTAYVQATVSVSVFLNLTLSFHQVPHDDTDNGEAGEEVRVFFDERCK